MVTELVKAGERLNEARAGAPEGKIIQRLEHGRRRGATQAFGDRPSEGDRGERAGSASRARAEEAGQPAAGDHTAVLHEFLGFEMGTGAVLGTGSMNDRKLPLVEDRR